VEPIPWEDIAGASHQWVPRNAFHSRRRSIGTSHTLRSWYPRRMLPPIEQVIHPKRHPSCKSRSPDRPAYKVMYPVVRVRIRADCHADSAIRTDGVPVTEAGVAVDAPTPGAIDLHPIPKGDGSTGAILSAFLAKSAEIDRDLTQESSISQFDRSLPIQHRAPPGGQSRGSCHRYELAQGNLASG